MNHIFISYSRHDIDFARYTRALLENLGFYVWMDEKRLSPGVDWWDEIEASIDSCLAFVIIMSPASRESVFCRNEILRALDQKKPLYPILYQGKHFGMIAHVQHEDMRGGLGDTFSDSFVQRLKNIAPLKSSKTIRVEVLHSSIEKVEADVLLHKLAPGSGGLDVRLVKKLNRTDSDFSKGSLKDVGDYAILETEGAIASKQVAFIKTEWVGGLGYRQVRQFAERGLAVLGAETPNAEHIIMTVHGVNTRLRLDEGESILAQFAGLIDVLQAWQAPYALKKITIVEFNKDRIKRIKNALQAYFDEVEYAQPSDNDDWGYDLTFERETAVDVPDAGAVDIKPYAIAIFPEDAELEDVFYYGIERPVHAMGLLCERLNPSDDATLNDMQSVLARIKSASTIICDITQITPQLYLQLGYAWGANVPTALITRNEQTPAELGKAVQYAKIWQLEERLSQWIKTTLNT